jgi:hypothetical protein
MNSDKDLLEGTYSPDRFIVELYSLIGQVTIQFVSLEHSVMETISKLISPDSGKLIIRLLAGDNFTVLLSKLKRVFLLQIQDDELKQKFKSIHGELNSIKDKRNKFLHSVWFVNNDDNDNKVIRFRFKSDIKDDPNIFEEEQNSLKNINDFIDRIINAKESLLKLDNKIIEYYNSLNKEKQNGKEQRETEEKTTT